jgi:hypothetical protein
LPLALPDLSPLLQGQGDHLAAGVAREVDFSGNGLRDKNIFLTDASSSARWLVPCTSGSAPFEKMRSAKLGVSGSLPT